MDTKIGKLVIDFTDGAVNIDVDDVLPIGQDLSSEFTKQPSLYAYIAVLAARAEAMWLESKRELDRIHAVIDKEVRKDLAFTDVKVTEAMVKAEIELRRGYHDALMDELDFREQHLIMQALTKAFEMRANMLISLGAHLRAEAQQTGMLISDFKDTLRQQKNKVIGERKRKKAKFDEAEEKDGDKPPF